LILAALSCLGWTANLRSQNVEPRGNEREAAALTSWISLDAPPGWEHLATDVLLNTLPGWQRDGAGNLVLRKGSGSPKRVVACAIDRPGFAVSEITDAGYLRLREAGSVRQHPLWVQFHEGQRIKVLTRGPSGVGVVTVKSTHLQRGRAANAPVASLDDLWVDVGARSRAEVQRLGIQMLDPVVRDLPAFSYADFVAGPSAGLRVGCAAVASAARGQVTTGETTFLLTTLRSFGHDGLEAALRQAGRVDELTLVDQFSNAESNTVAGVLQRRVEQPAFLPDSIGITSLLMLAPKSRFAGSLVESVQLSDANALLAAVENSAGVKRGRSNDETGWVQLPPRRSENSPPGRVPVDPFATAANLLRSLADLPAVSGHEREVREAIIAALPPWARQRAATDLEGNLVVEIGPDVDPVMFIAHQDEVGFEVTNIATDGTVALRTRGGVFQSLWEGQPALLHFDRGKDNSPARQPLSGVFIPRETAASKQPEALAAWFGLDAAALHRLGVTVGQSVTSPKHAVRLAGGRFTARALDDRAGSTALILAARGIDPLRLKRRVIFSWSVREETGLEGAIALAKRYGSSVKRVFSVDTFVSSDSPMETTRFAFAPLGQGAVIRGLDNSSVALPRELDRIVAIARSLRIPLQVGATNGGTDGSEFVRYGVIHASLSWPGRYSHSPVEVLDLRDLQSLSRLIHALATMP
jgi:putative aminopeptidase FrvX